MRAFAEGVGTRFRVSGSILYVTDHLGRLIDKIQGGLSMMSWPVRCCSPKTQDTFAWII
jgi:hypothetical protein